MKRSSPLEPSGSSYHSAQFYRPAGTRDTSNGVRILIADAHPLLRHGLAALLALYADMDVCALASDGHEAIEQLRQHRPEVVLTDLRLTSIDGLDAIQAIRAECPDARIIAMTTFPEKQLITRAFASGAVACWLKTSPLTDLIATIRALDVVKAKGAPELSDPNGHRGSADPS